MMRTWLQNATCFLKRPWKHAASDRPDEREGPLTGSEDELTAYLQKIHDLQLEIYPLDEMVRIDASRHVHEVTRAILLALME